MDLSTCRGSRSPNLRHPLTPSSHVHGHTRTVREPSLPQPSEPLVPDGRGAVSGPGVPQGGPQAETVQATAELMAQGGSDGGGCGRSIARRANNETSDSIEIGNNDNNNSDVGTGSGISPTDWGPHQQQQGDHRQHSLPRETTGQDHGGGGGATRGYLERRSTSTAATREPTVTMSPVEPFHMAAVGGHQHVGMMTIQDGRHVGRDNAGSGNVYRVGGSSRGGSGTAGGGGGVEGSRRGVVPAPKRRRPPSTATATYTWSVEPRKGGVREKLTATIDAADMAKVRMRSPEMCVCGRGCRVGVGSALLLGGWRGLLRDKLFVFLL